MSQAGIGREELLRQCSHRELEAVAFLDLLLEGQKVVHGIVMDAIKENFLESAEIILQSPLFVKREILDVQELLTPPEPEAVKQAIAEAKDAEKATEPIICEESQREDLPETVPDQEMPQQAEVKRASFFETITIPDWVETALGKISNLATFEQAFKHAKVCPGLRHFPSQIKEAAACQ